MADRLAQSFGSKMFLFVTVKDYIFLLILETLILELCFIKTIINLAISSFFAEHVSR